MTMKKALSAIKAGFRSIPYVALAAGITQKQARSSIHNLVCRGHVERVGSRHGGVRGSIRGTYRVKGDTWLPADKSAHDDIAFQALGARSGLAQAMARICG